MRRPTPYVLVAENDAFVANALEVWLTNRGAKVLGPVSSVRAALDLIARCQRIDCALLDVQLHDEAAFSVADALRARGVRFAFTRGCGSLCPPAYRDERHFDRLQTPRELLRWALGP